MADIKVELKLGLDGMRKDLEEAKKALKAAMGVNLSKQISGLEKAAKAQTDWAAAIELTTAAWKDMMSAMGTALPKMPKIPTPGDTGGSPFTPLVLPTPGDGVPPVLPGGGGGGGKSPTGSGGAGGTGVGARGGTNAFLKNIGFAAMPLFNPLSPLSILAGFRQGGQALGTGPGTAFRRQMGSMLGGMGMRGMGGAVGGFGASSPYVASGVLTVGAVAAGLSLMALSNVAKTTAAAFDEAKRIYSATLRSGGLPLGMVTQRSAVAKAMGVSMEEMDHYANVVAQVGWKFRHSSEILASTAPALMMASVNMEAVKQEFKALGAVIADSIAPAVNLLAMSLQWLLAGVQALFKAFFDYMMTIPRIFKGVLENLPFVGDTMKEAFAGLGGGVDTPEASTKRLPASSWEKMGLVIGTGAGANYAKDTAANTKRIAEILSGRGSEKPTFNPGGMPMAFNGA